MHRTVAVRRTGLVRLGTGADRRGFAGSVGPVDDIEAARFRSERQLGTRLDRL